MESDRRLTLEDARQVINEQDRKKLTLEEARKVINEQDAIILEAFEKRMAAAKGRIWRVPSNL